MPHHTFTTAVASAQTPPGVTLAHLCCTSPVLIGTFEKKKNQTDIKKKKKEKNNPHQSTHCQITVLLFHCAFVNTSA